jgi:ferredoxin
MTGRKIEIDWTRCDGHGLCAELLPGRIVMDEWGFPLVRTTDVTAAEEKDARRAVSLCPALALRLAGR